MMGSEKSPPPTDLMAYGEGGQEETASDLLENVWLLIQKIFSRDLNEKDLDELVENIDKMIQLAKRGVEKEFIQKLEKCREVILAIKGGRFDTANILERIKHIRSTD